MTASYVDRYTMEEQCPNPQGLPAWFLFSKAILDKCILQFTRNAKWDSNPNRRHTYLSNKTSEMLQPSRAQDLSTYGTVEYSTMAINTHSSPTPNPVPLRLAELLQEDSSTLKVLILYLRMELQTLEIYFRYGNPDSGTLDLSFLESFDFQLEKFEVVFQHGSMKIEDPRKGATLKLTVEEDVARVDALIVTGDGGAELGSEEKVYRIGHVCARQPARPGCNNGPRAVYKNDRLRWNFRFSTTKH
jgi:hypothetical protein